MKKVICVVATAVFLCVGCVGLLAGCAGASQNGSNANNTSSNDTVEVVCATFPAYDWVCQVVGDRADRYNIEYLMDNGTDLHSYQPSVEDIAKISKADLFIYVGGESDGWAADAVQTADNPDLHAMSMLETVGDAAVEEEVVEGMESDEHEHGDEADNDEERGEEAEYDEHVWLSLRNAQTLVDAIAAQLSEIDPQGAKSYAENATAYDAKLADLDRRYAKAVADGAHKEVVFADRFPFRYLTEDYGISYYAAFVGCSAETEASFETVAFLAKKVDELGLGSVLVIEGSSQDIARTVVQNTREKNQKILVMDSLQSTTRADVEAGKTYLSAMEQNLSTLADALK